MQASIDFAWARQMASSLIPTSVSSSISSSASRRDRAHRDSISALPALPPDSDHDEDDACSPPGSFSLPISKPASTPKGPRPQRTTSIDQRGRDEIPIRIPVSRSASVHSQASDPPFARSPAQSPPQSSTASIIAAQSSLDPWLPQSSPEVPAPISMSKQRLTTTEDLYNAIHQPTVDRTPLYQSNDGTSPFFMDNDNYVSQTPQKTAVPNNEFAPLSGLSVSAGRSTPVIYDQKSNAVTSPAVSSPTSIPSPISSSPPRVLHRTTPLSPVRPPPRLTKDQPPVQSPPQDTILVGSASVLVSDKWDVELAAGEVDEWEKIDCLSPIMAPPVPKPASDDWEHLQKTDIEEDWDQASVDTGTGGQGDENDWREEEDEDGFFQPTARPAIARGRSTGRDLGAMMSSVSINGVIDTSAGFHRPMSPPTSSNIHAAATSRSPVSPASSRSAETRKVMKEMARMSNRGSSTNISPHRTLPPIASAVTAGGTTKGSSVPGLTRGVGAVAPPPPRARTSVFAGIMGGDW